jgi:ATP-dependent RNA helicase HelY
VTTDVAPAPGALDPERFARDLGYPLDRFQAEAIAHLADGRDVLVAAPTGAGKTVVGEYACAAALATGRRAFYTTPIKALSNQKHRDLVAAHGEDRVGLLTGDRSVNGGAPIVVMTTEVLRNMLYADADPVRDLGFVVLDEVHYLADRERGAVWEEVILNLPRHVRLAALSATVSNAEQFGSWLDLVRGGCALVLEERRPVPLRHHYFVNGRVHDTFITSRSGSSREQREAAARAEGGVPNPEVLMLEQRSRRRVVDRRGRAHRGGPRLRWPSRVEVAEELAARGWLPGIVFVFSRAGCDAAVTELRRSGIVLTEDGERDRIADLIDERLWELPVEDLEVLGVEDWRRSLMDGVAAHHAGLIPLFKEVVEALFQAGLLKLVFATETLALGINMPARSVVIERLEKYDGEGHHLITPGQYTQLTGRAGRRGIDPVGHAVVLHQRDVEFRVTAGLVGARSYPLRSSFAPSYNMTVNLLRRHDRAHAEEVLRRSFAQYELDAETARDELRLAELAAEGAGPVGCDRGDWTAYWVLRGRLTETERVAERGRRGREVTDRAVIDGLRTELRAHPCHACPERAAHERTQRRSDRAAGEAASLRSAVERRGGSLVRALARLVAVLAERGHLDAADRPTATGHLLMGLHGATDLLATELLAGGVLDGLSPVELAGTVALLVHEPRRDDAVPAEDLRVGPGLATVLGEVQTIAAALRAVEQRHGVAPLRDLDPGLVPVAVAWADGAPLEEALADRELTGGDFVRSMKQCIDLLGQLRDVAGGPTRLTLTDAARALQRGIVAA